MRNRTRELIAVSIFLFASIQVWAQAPTVIKVATDAPKGTSPHQALLRMGTQWRKASGGKVQVTIYTDGTQGGESDSIRRMRVRQLQASLLSVIGLAEIEPSTSALQNLPMMFQSFEELDYVQQELTAEMGRRVSARG